MNMNIIKTNGIIIVNSGVPAEAAPVVVKDEEGNALFFFGKSSEGEVSECAFVGNTVCDDGSIGLILDADANHKQKRSNAKLLMNADKYVADAKVAAASIMQDKAAVKAFIAELYNTTEDADEAGSEE